MKVSRIDAPASDSGVTLTIRTAVLNVAKGASRNLVQNGVEPIYDLLGAVLPCRFELVLGMILKTDVLRFKRSSVVHLRDDRGHRFFAQSFQLFENLLLSFVFNLTEASD